MISLPLIDLKSYAMALERRNPRTLFGQFAAVDFPLNLNLPELRDRSTLESLLTLSLLQLESGIPIGIGIALIGSGATGIGAIGTAGGSGEGDVKGEASVGESKHTILS
jgi:hypothetical protein